MEGVKATIELIQILTDCDNLPLYIRSKFTENILIVESLLKGDRKQ
jgi:hypothetical protein